VIDRYSLTTAVHCDEQLRMLGNARLSKPVNIQLKMNSGIEPARLYAGAFPGRLERARQCRGVGQITLMTHFSDADGPAALAIQLEAFERGPKASRVRAAWRIGGHAVARRCAFRLGEARHHLVRRLAVGQNCDIATTGLRPAMTLGPN